MLLDFYGDYKHVIINACHKLILIRTRNDNNCIVRDPAIEPTLNYSKYNGECLTLH